MVFSEKILAGLPCLVNVKVPMPEHMDGLAVTKNNGKTFVNLRGDGGGLTYTFRSDVLEISWGVEVSYGDVYKVPCLETNPSDMEGDISLNMDEKILKALGFRPIKIHLPEKVTQLPIPDWVGRKSLSGMSKTGLDSMYCFVSEAWEKVEAYMHLVDGAISYFPKYIWEDTYELTPYGKAVALRMLDFWEKHGIVNPERFEKVVDKYKKMRIPKGWHHARCEIMDIHGFSMDDLARIYPAYFVPTPEEKMQKRQFDLELEREQIKRATGMMFNTNIMHGYWSFDQLRFAAQLFGSMELSPGAKFFDGYYAAHECLCLFFLGKYRINVDIESFAGDDLAKEIECKCTLTKDGETIREGKFIDRSYRNLQTIANRALEECLMNICVVGEKVEKGSNWPITVGETEKIYDKYGPFCLKYEAGEAEVVLERKENKLWLEGIEL